MIAALLMAAAPPPLRTDKPVGLISATDYPQHAIDKEEEGPVAFKALVAPDGTVDKCTIMVSSHYRDLDDATCTLVEGRARFAPARDASGNPMYGVYKAVITWSLGNVISGGLDPELELQINQAPAGVKLPIVMTCPTGRDPTAQPTTASSTSILLRHRQCSRNSPANQFLLNRPMSSRTPMASRSAPATR